MRIDNTIVIAVIAASALTSACGGSARPGSTQRATTATSAATPARADSTTTEVGAQNAPVRVALLLPGPDLVSGRRVDATLVIQNDSGAPVRSDSCVPPGESVLGQIGLSTYPPPPTTTTAATASTSSTLPRPSEGGCRGPVHEMVGVGTTRVRFTLEASSSLCQLAPATQLQVHACLPGGTPLRPGTYYVSFDWYGSALPTPTITVPVVASTR